MASKLFTFTFTFATAQTPVKRSTCCSSSSKRRTELPTFVTTLTSVDKTCAQDVWRAFCFRTHILIANGATAAAGATEPYKRAR